MEKMRATFYVLTILGALLVAVLAQETLNTTANTTTPGDLNTSTVNITHSEGVSNGSKANDDNMPTSESATISSTQMTTEKDGNQNVTTSPARKSTMTKMTPPSKDGNENVSKPEITTKSTTTKKTPPSKVYIFVLVAMILIFVIFAIIYFYFKVHRKRFTVNITSKHEDAQIPLASVEPEMCDSSPKALTEADQEVKESPEKSSAPAEKPSEPLVVDDVDPTASNKTSVETLNDVLNENNSNNNAVHDASVCFIDICLNN
ncbi:hypothetical protein QTP70_024411 [Hemibagrus guttatus]|uniref:Uncharacterized protein n=1 Tax=Hemibagrus guttatus TaxID=175788 RepID=A0AAE0VFG2_9TELE|nr:hypothetical protein QTP70_024411 [Hemibagrus guttatus]